MPKGPRAKKSSEARRVIRRAIQHGRAQAELAYEFRRKLRAQRAALGVSNGLLIAEGDSWFDYPLWDILKKLEAEHGFEVESAAHMGDPAEAMAHVCSQHDGLAKVFQRIADQGEKPRAIVLSGGGNDVAGPNFGFLLNHAASGLRPLNDRIVAGVVEDRLKFSLVSLISTVTEFSRKYLHRTTPVVVHGYDYPVPDGRGFLGGFWFLPGPWLHPGFVEKGYDTPDKLKDNCKVMVELIDRFNAMVGALPAEPELRHVTYVDLRGTLSQRLARDRYKVDWGNELHPTDQGFSLVAKKFAKRILQIPAA
jgi:hypothetical protein